MAATLANNGVNPLTGERALKTEHVKNVLSVMASCGMYDYSGGWVYRVGLPVKSGVGGGVIAVLTGFDAAFAADWQSVQEEGDEVRFEPEVDLAME